MGRLSPFKRYLVYALWLTWPNALTAMCALLVLFFAIMGLLVADGPPSPLFMMLLFSWSFGAYLALILHGLKPALTSPMPRKRIFRGIFGPTLLGVTCLGILAAALAPLTVRANRRVMQDSQVQEERGWRSHTDESPQAFARRKCEDIRRGFGVTVRPEEILTVHGDASVIDFAAVKGRLRWARTQLVLCATLVALLALLLGLWTTLPGRKACRSPLRMRLRRDAYGVCFLLTMALWFASYGHRELQQGTSLFMDRLRGFLVAHFWIVAPTMLIACVLLWIRHERAFRYAEIVSPLYRGSRWSH